MAYIPPHKRHLKDPVKPSPLPDYLVKKFKKNIDIRSSTNTATDRVITYSRALDSIFKWLLIDSNGVKDSVPPSAKLVPLSSDVEKPLVLINDNLQKVSVEEERALWLLLAEKVEEDLVSAYEQAKKRVVDHHNSDNAKLRLVASGHCQAGPVAEYMKLASNRRFTSNVPTSFIENIKSKAIPSFEFCIDAKKEIYIVKLSHYMPTYKATVSCKCTVKEDGKLSMYKANLNPVRHLVVDVSCIDKNLDMRLMLAGKRKMTTLTEREMSNIQGLLDYATVDPNVKGGLRWPDSKTPFENGYRVLESCHVRTTIFKNQALRLRLRETDRFSEVHGTGEMERGVTLILEDINTKLQEQNIERSCVIEMLRDALGTIWDFFGCYANLS